MSGQPETIVSPRPEICSTITLYKYISKRGLEGLIENGSLKVTYRSDCNDPQEMTPYGEHPDKYNTYPENGFISFSKEGNNAPMIGILQKKACAAPSQGNVSHSKKPVTTIFNTNVLH